MFEYIKPDFPSLADEIAEPHPDMNINVAAFTVSEKSCNTKNRCHIIVASTELSFKGQNKQHISFGSLQFSQKTSI